MAVEKDTKGIMTRLSLDVISMLDELCMVSGLKRSEIVANLISAEYDRIHGNPKMKEIVEQMRILTETMEGMRKVVQSDALVSGDKEGR